MVKKILSLTLALCMSAVCLTACGKSKDIDDWTDDDFEAAINSMADKIDKDNSKSDKSSIPADDSTEDDQSEESDGDPCLAQMEAATLQYPSQNDEWKYNVYDCYIELTEYLGEEEEELIIPNEIDGLPVWVYNCKSPYEVDSWFHEVVDGGNTVTKSIKLPDGLMKLGNEAFLGYTALESIAIPEGITEIPLKAFEYCESLKAVKLPDSLVEIKDYAFEYCDALESIELPEGLVSISNRAFHDCHSLKSITLPASLTSSTNGFCGTGYDPATDECYGLELTVLNPECVIKQEWLQHSFSMIYGYAGSTAAQFAADNGIPFKLIEE